MFDSIDFIIENINIYDLQLDILKPKVYQFTKNTQVNKYTENIIDFEYKTVKFNYYFKACSLLIHTNAHRILNKTSVDLQDKKEYINKLNNILDAVIKNLKKYKVELMRIDYCVDLKLDEKINDYIGILNNNVHTFKYMKMKTIYDTSIHLNTKYGKQNINIYNRYEKTKDINDLGILRLEIQNKKRLVKVELKRYGLTRELDNYWDINSMEDYFFNIVEGYCYTGYHYKRKIANKIIDNSSYTKSMKEKLKQFLLEVENCGLEGVRNKYNHCKISTRIQKLALLNINPIPLPDTSKYEKLEGLTSLSREVARKHYFYKNN